MPDNLSPEQRNVAMRGVKSQDTSIEITVRHLLRSIGKTGYRLHRRDIPGNPDIAWIGKKIALFIHGCFWHGHNCKRGERIPATNKEYWLEKIRRNRKRDAGNLVALTEAGWLTMIIWECELRRPNAVIEQLIEFFAAASIGGH